MKHAIPTIWHNLLHLFFPRLCVLCGCPLTNGEEQLCLACINRLPRTEGAMNGEAIVHQLAWYGNIQDAIAFLHYTKGGEVQQLIHAFKYRGKKELAFVLGRLTALEAKSDQRMIWTADGIVPVPLTRRKKLKRGYNQAEWIALGIQSVQPIPLCRCLKRIQTSGSQTRKSVYERRRSMENAITVVNPEMYAGRHLLLVDDVMTTGATLGACLNALQTIPDVRISILVLAIV